MAPAPPRHPGAPSTWHRLGWKYVEAFEESQKYKEGKFILEKAMIMKEEERKRVESAALNDQASTPPANLPERERIAREVPLRQRAPAAQLLELDQNIPRSTSEGEADQDDVSAAEIAHLFPAPRPRVPRPTAPHHNNRNRLRRRTRRRTRTRSRGIETTGRATPLKRRAATRARG